MTHHIHRDVWDGEEGNHGALRDAACNESAVLSEEDGGEAQSSKQTYGMDS